MDEAHRPDRTLRDYLEAWLVGRDGEVEPLTLKGYRDTVRRFLAPHLGHLQLGALTPQQVTEGYASIAREATPRWIRYSHAVLRKALNDAVRDGLLAGNPCTETTVPVPPTPRHRTPGPVWTPAELEVFLAATASTRWGPLWAVAAGTGLVGKQLLGLSWGDVDLDGRRMRAGWRLTIVHRRAERLPPRFGAAALPIDEQTVEALLAQRRQQEAWRTLKGPLWHHPWALVFTRTDGRPLQDRTVAQSFRDAVARLELPPVSLRSLGRVHRDDVEGRPGP